MTSFALPDTRLSVTRAAYATRCAMVAAMVVAGAVVYREPSPYEFVGVLAILVAFGTGMRMHPRLWPMTFLLLAYISFGVPAMLQAQPVRDGVIWTSVSAFLAGTALLFAAFVAERPKRNFTIVAWAYVVGGVIAATAAVAGYFGIAGGDLFVLYGRARGTFQDPNVLGPFLIMPFLFLAEGTLRGGLGSALLRSVPILPIALGILLTFSRGAWGHLAVSGALLAFFTFALSHSVLARLRVLIMLAIGAMVLVAGLGTALSIPKVQALFTERAQLTQEYDTGHEGRFGRWSRGFALALEEPLGIGPLEFGKRFPEDPHNVYLNALMSFGWGGALAYYVLVVSTIVMGFRAMFVPTPWQRQTIIAFSTFLPLALLGVIIDTDHWRHFFLVLGCLWGLIAATESARLSAAAKTLVVQRAEA